MNNYHVPCESPELHKLRCTAKYRRMRGKLERAEITEDEYYDWLKKQLAL